MILISDPKGISMPEYLDLLKVETPTNVVRREINPKEAAAQKAKKARAKAKAQAWSKRNTEARENVSKANRRRAHYGRPGLAV